MPVSIFFKSASQPSFLYTELSVKPLECQLTLQLERTDCTRCETRTDSLRKSLDTGGHSCCRNMSERSSENSRDKNILVVD
jgi:hypothetical protein